MSASEHEPFMRRAIGLARRAWGATHPNPMVGCVLAEDGEVAQLLGLRSERLLLGAVVYGSMLAGLAGVMLAPLLSVSVNLGWSLGLTAFAGAIIGGFGSMSGALIGGVVVGLAGEFASRYIPGDYADSVVFGLVVIVLLVRPSGILSMIPGQKV